MRVRVRQYQRNPWHAVHALVGRRLQFEYIVPQHSRAYVTPATVHRVRTPVLRLSVGKHAVEHQQRRVRDGLLFQFKDGLHE